MIPLATIAASTTNSGTQIAMNPGGLTQLEISQLFNCVNGTSVIDFSFRLLDLNLNPIAVPGGPASDPAELPPIFVQNCSYEMNTTRDVHRQMTLDLFEWPGLTYNPLAHRLQIYCDYYDGIYTFDGFGNVEGVTGTRVLHIPQGVFMAAFPDRDLSDQVPVWHLNPLYDETFALQQLNFLNTYTIPAGTNRIQAVKTLLQIPLLPPSQGGTAVTPAGCDFAGPNITASRILIPASSSVVPADIVYTEDDTILKAVNDLLEGGENPYWPLWQDERGNFVSRAVDFSPSVDGWEYDSARQYDPSTGKGNLIKPPVKQSFSTQGVQFGNCVKVISANAQTDAFSAIAFNRDSRSAASVQNIGRVITQKINNDTLSSQAAAQALADVKLQVFSSVFDSLSLEAMVVPVHQVHDASLITVRGQGAATYTGSGKDLDVAYADGPVLVSSAGGPYSEVSWKVDCGSRLASRTYGAQVAI